MTITSSSVNFRSSTFFNRLDNCSKKVFLTVSLRLSCLGGAALVSASRALGVFCGMGCCFCAFGVVGDGGGTKAVIFGCTSLGLAGVEVKVGLDVIGAAGTTLDRKSVV